MATKYGGPGLSSGEFRPSATNPVIDGVHTLNEVKSKIQQLEDVYYIFGKDVSVKEDLKKIVLEDLTKWKLVLDNWEKH
jgi:hypothetical protein